MRGVADDAIAFSVRHFFLPNPFYIHHYAKKLLLADSVSPVSHHTTPVANYLFVGRIISRLPEVPTTRVYRLGFHTTAVYSTAGMIVGTVFPLFRRALCLGGTDSARFSGLAC